jgi:hypothetical protein
MQSTIINVTYINVECILFIFDESIHVDFISWFDYEKYSRGNYI